MIKPKFVLILLIVSIGCKKECLPVSTLLDGVNIIKYSDEKFNILSSLSNARNFYLDKNGFIYLTALDEAGNRDPELIKLNDKYEKLWSNKFQGDVSYIEMNLIPLSNSQMEVLFSNYNSPSQSIVLRKFNSNGLLISTFYFNSKNKFIRSRFATQLQDSDFIISSATRSNYSSIIKKAEILRIKPDGTELWNKSFDEEYKFNPRSVGIVNSKDAIYYLTESTGEIANEKDSLNFRILDLNGNIIIERAIQTDASVFPETSEVLQNINQEFLIVYTAIDDNDCNYEDLYMVKLDLKGKELWRIRYGTQESEVSNKTIQTKDGGYICVATLYRNHNTSLDNINTANSDLLLIKINHNGDITWANSYGGNSLEAGVSIIEKSNGNFLILGASTNNTPYSIYYPFFLEVDPNGRPL